MKEFLKKKYAQNIVAAAGVILLTIIIELLFNIKLLTLEGREKGVRSIELYDCTTENLTQERDGAFLLKKGEKAAISFDVNGYADRLAVKYDTEGTFSCTLSVKYVNIYGNTETVAIEDINPVYLNESVINIKKNVESVTISINECDYDLTIEALSVRNTVIFNPLRMLFFFFILLAAAMIIVWHREITDRIYAGFAIVAGCAGLAMITVMPLVRVGFDEEAHLRNAFVLTFESVTEENEILWNMLNTVDANHPEYHSCSYEEYVSFRKYLNDNALYKNNGVDEFRTTYRTTSSMPTFAYVFVALGINVARLFGMGFGNIYMLARIINLLVYVVTMTFAIKNLKKGRMLMSVIGLMPTVMFLSSTVSYDPVIIGFTALGLSYLLNGFVDDNEQLTWKKYLMGCGFLGYGCLAKAVYAPLFLMGLFYPKTKFKDKKTRIIMKFGYVLCFVILMLTAVLPLLAGHDGGDDRGGNTSHMGQLAYMTGNLAGYAWLLIKSAGRYLFEFSIGASALDNMYFFGKGMFTVPLVIILVTVIFTQGEEGFNFKLKYRLAAGACVLISAALIWTSMYMAFTEAGTATAIYGVQGRYFIPLLFTGLSIIGTSGITCRWKKDRFYPSVFLIMLFILAFETYSQIFMYSCA